MRKTYSEKYNHGNFKISIFVTNIFKTEILEDILHAEITVFLFFTNKLEFPVVIF